MDGRKYREARRKRCGRGNKKWVTYLDRNELNIGVIGRQFWIVSNSNPFDAPLLAIYAGKSRRNLI